MTRILKTIILIAIITTGCANQQNTNSDRITLIYWSANNQYEMDLAKTIVNEWNQTHPNIRVKQQAIPEGRSSEEVILAAVVGKTTPDVYSNLWPGDVESYVRANALLSLDQFNDFDSLATDRFSDDFIKEAKSTDGRTYQILWKTNPIMMAYNKTMLANAGFTEPPRTYDEFLTLAERIKQDTDGDGYVDRWVGITQILVAWWQRFFDYYTLYIAASNGGTLVQGDSVTFDNEYSVEVFRFLQTLFARDYFPKERMDARADVFIHSIVATRFTGPYAITQIERFKSDDFQYGFAPVPRPIASDTPEYTYGDYKSIVIFKNTKYPNESWKFMKYLISRKNDLRLLELADQLPIRKNILQDSLFIPYFAKNPMKVKFAHQAQYVRGADSSPVLREIFDAISQEFEASVIYGAKSPEEAVKAAAERARLIMK
ncbi:extracellular solute-binding protein [candidate division KSB1 bacterium]|nr:extracellular solute-binding protein [candidate division KSB1 bacterium]